MLTDKQMRALSSFNTSDGLLESAIEHLREGYYSAWMNSKEEHIKQREALFTKTLVLEDLIKVIREATNKTIFD